MDRVVQVPAGRMEPWLGNFARRHGEPEVTTDAATLTLAAPDGAVARVVVPWLWPDEPWQPGGDPVADLLAHLALPRRFGVVLARRQAHAVGVVEGTTVTASANDRHYVQGRTKAGGWSQQRYARRRANQARAAFEDAADDVARVLVPVAGTLDFLVTGGEQTAVDAVLSDPRLKPLAEVRARSPRRAWPTPDPRRATLDEFVSTFQSVPVELNDLA